MQYSKWERWNWNIITTMDRGISLSDWKNNFVSVKFVCTGIPQHMITIEGNFPGNLSFTLIAIGLLNKIDYKVKAFKWCKLLSLWA